MPTAKDQMVELAEKFSCWSTSDGVKLLRIEDVPNNIYAGNMYMIALRVIRELSQENKKLKEKLGKRS